MTEIVVFDTKIKQDENGRYSLNDLHKAAMAKGHATISHRPAGYLRNANVKAFIDELDLEARNCASVKSIKGGKNQGTYATELVALRYAGWISAKVEVEVYKTFQKVLHNDEGLTHQLIEGQQDPKAQQRLAIRAQSKVARQKYTDTLKDHGVDDPRMYGHCTDAMYKELFGHNAKGLRIEKGLSAKANVRNNMDSDELTVVMFTELLAQKRIIKDEAKGYYECKDKSAKAAIDTKEVIDR